MDSRTFCDIMSGYYTIRNDKSSTHYDRHPEEIKHPGIYRYLPTNPNRDLRVYKEETLALKELMLGLGKELKVHGKSAYIFPGHGAYYIIDELVEKQ